MPSELCTPRSVGKGSIAAAADPMGSVRADPMRAVRAESVGQVGLLREGEGSRGRRGSRAVASGWLAGGDAGFGRLKP